MVYLNVKMGKPGHSSVTAEEFANILPQPHWPLPHMEHFKIQRKRAGERGREREIERQ